MTLTEYFALSNTPMPNSPVGRLMQTIVQDEPGINFEEARKQAQECLNRAAGRKSYQVYTPKQEAKQRERLEARRRRIAP